MIKDVLLNFPHHLLAAPQTASTPASALLLAQQLASQFAATAAERDHAGGTPKAERDAIRASGLLGLSIAREFGGMGANWQETLLVVREFAKADSSVAHVFAFHHLMLATVELFGRPEQWQPWHEITTRQHWFWGNALNPLDERTISKRLAGWHEFSGQKSFCSGALDSQMLVVSARSQPGGQLVVAAIPTGRSGISVQQDWNNIGQRQTDSGSVHFEKVRIENNEILDTPGPLTTPRSCLRPLLAQLILTNIYLGIAEGAFEEARHYTLHEARPWQAAQVDHTHEDPYILGHYGEFWVGLESVRALTDRAGARLVEALARGEALSESERGEVAMNIAAAKVAATRMGLNLACQMFEVTGARATHAGLRLDRHWRNLRTHTLHDPVDYKLKELGEWALIRSYPTPTFYS